MIKKKMSKWNREDTDRLSKKIMKLMEKNVFQISAAKQLKKKIRIGYKNRRKFVTDSLCTINVESRFQKRRRNLLEDLDLISSLR